MGDGVDEAAIDPVPALAARLAACAPDIVLAGRRSQGGEESGLVPYALARALSLPLVSDVVAAAAEDGALRLDQSLGRGALRRVRVQGPVVVTCHSDAPAPLAYAYGRARRGTVAALAVAPAAMIWRAGTQPDGVSMRRSPRRWVVRIVSERRITTSKRR